MDMHQSSVVSICGNSLKRDFHNQLRLLKNGEFFFMQIRFGNAVSNAHPSCPNVFWQLRYEGGERENVIGFGPSKIHLLAITPCENEVGKVNPFTGLFLERNWLWNSFLFNRVISNLRKVVAVIRHAICFSYHAKARVDWGDVNLNFSGSRSPPYFPFCVPYRNLYREVPKTNIYAKTHFIWLDIYERYGNNFSIYS